MHIKLVLISLLFLNTYFFAQECTSNIIIHSNSNSFLLVDIDSIKMRGARISLNLTKGKHTLKVHEYKKWNSIFNDTLFVNNCNDTISKNYIFKKNNEFEKINLSSVFNNNYKFHESSLYKILTSSAIVLGAISAYYKINADKKYDEYLLTNDQATLKKVNKYDLISGVSFSLLQINFGYLIYRFLTD
ncbi:hypothetical protein [Stygiobacter electus]|uniref:PEGA domain-containing protein n=1 Tax=Stygiobacter electus TaxID=3032292 RepID=A0AAE3NWR7_9BACT|nr:hypothetical protein [Stygiobacter electus]MDF1611466.1 hypothetical protein [Stygiobacter electus]